MKKDDDHQETCLDDDIEHIIVHQLRHHPEGQEEKQKNVEKTQVDTFIIDFEPMLTDSQVQIMQGMITETDDV